MRYDIERLPADFITFINHVHANAGYERHAYRLARALQVRVRAAAHNRAFPEAEPQAVIEVQPWYFGWDNDVIRHELSHVLMYWSGLESHMIAEYGLEDGKARIEQLCQQAVAFLRIPQPLIEQAVRKHGVTARAVAQLQKTTGAPAQMALERLVFDRPDEERGGLIVSNSHVAAVAVCNVTLPVWLGWRVPEPRITLKGATFSRLPEWGSVVAVFSGTRVDDYYWEPA